MHCRILSAVSRAARSQSRTSIARRVAHNRPLIVASLGRPFEISESASSACPTIVSAKFGRARRYLSSGSEADLVTVRVENHKVEVPTGSTFFDVAKAWKPDGPIPLACIVDGTVFGLSDPVNDSTTSTEAILEASVEFVFADDARGQQVMDQSAALLTAVVLRDAVSEKGLIVDNVVTGTHEDHSFYCDVVLNNSKSRNQPTTISATHLEDFENGVSKLLQSRTRLLQRKSGECPRDADTIVIGTADDIDGAWSMDSSIGNRVNGRVFECDKTVVFAPFPVVRHAGLIKACLLTATSAVEHHRSDGSVVSMQRVSGIAFASKTALEEWKVAREAALARDHRTIGQAQGLFMFHSASPGSAFMLPAGARLYKTLVSYLQREYIDRGYEEVITPMLFSKTLWETSGHWQHYRDDMFLVVGGDCCGDRIHPNDIPASLSAGAGRHDHERAHKVLIDEPSMGLKPMNCPGHCLIFASRPRSYRELPLRLAEFSPLHRNEAAGALSGLTRVRRFAQDDAHIFCARSQVQAEITDCVSFIRDTYSRLGFQLHLALSTRPDDFVGQVSVWDEAEGSLRDALDAVGVEYSVKDKDGAFYGPKIDVGLTDALHRKHQCGTIQLDFQLPQSFGLKFTKADGDVEQPVIVHRAVLGSVERMMAILIEHYGGKWPLWLNPKQALVLPLSEQFADHAKAVATRLRKRGFHSAVGTTTGTTLSKAIRDAQLEQWNYILVVGEKEAESDSVNVRDRDAGKRGVLKVEELMLEMEQRVGDFQ